MSSATPDPVANTNAGANADSAPHRLADDAEEIYFQGSPVMRGEIGRMLITFIIGALLIVLPLMAWIMKWNWPGMLSLVLVLIGIIVIMIPIVIMKSVRYRISNYRIDYERGLLSKNIDTLELWHVEDIRFHQSLLDRIFGVGTITVISHDDTTPQLALKGIPKPRPVFEALKQRIIAVKRQRGVIKMDAGT